MDSYSTGATLAFAALALLLFVVLAMANAAIATISRKRLRDLDEQATWGASSALTLHGQIDELAATTRTVRLLLASLVTATIVVVTADRFAPLLVALLVVAALLLAEAIGSAMGRRAYATFAPALAPLLQLLMWLTAPIRSLMRSLWQLVSGRGAEEELQQRREEEEQRLLASLVGEESETSFPAEQREMVHNILDLGQTSVREVMVPRPDLVTLSADTTVKNALDTIVSEGHSRIPVYEGDVDNIVGLLYAKDLFADLRDGHHELPIRDRLRPPLFVPSSRMAAEVLEQLQRSRIHLAIIFDEYGGTAGLVTIEDILEEIVGEIQDEYDSEEAPFIPLTATEAIVSGRYDIDDLNDAMGLDLPTDENDTVGGLVYSALGRVPTLKDVIELADQKVTLRVKQMDGHRILKVRVTVHEPTDDSESVGQPTSEASRRLGSTLSLW
ncbi:MAG: HlyC/CorC family transporter [Anaerolineales bacterium]|nr:HlyC/CorC family transporter [Anaerolineales bacterium]MCB9127890.1 HlyC/CorC family transporter [Ardenticatenales bacterium]MCB9171652.1 HlyC/CorC family transporter [Ardenticatenales bacterium]